VSAVTFIPVTEEHRPLLQSWVVQPHWQEWWGEPEEELRMIYAIEDGEHQPYLACINDEPVAYIQAWWPSKHPDIHWVRDMKMSERGVDISIGDARQLGQGLGTLVVKAFAAKLFAEGATRLVIDPDKRNTRAIACYSKAGFTAFAEHEGDWLMELLPEECVWMKGV
jgi:aminoglycoside 6'-N-acetyltransferase